MHTHAHIHTHLFAPIIISPLIRTLLPPFYKKPHNFIHVTRIIQAYFTILRPLIQSYLRIVLSLSTDHEHLWRGKHYPVYHNYIAPLGIMWQPEHTHLPLLLR